MASAVKMQINYAFGSLRSNVAVLLGLEACYLGRPSQEYCHAMDTFW